MILLTMNLIDEMKMSENEIASLRDFSHEIDEMRSDMRNEKLRMMIATLLKECRDNDEVISLCVEMECIIDEIKSFINKKHKISERYHLPTYDENGNPIIL